MPTFHYCRTLAATVGLAMCVVQLLTESVMGQNPIAKDSAKWIQLFNGKDLEGWTPKIRYSDLGDNYGNTFRVQDGILQVRYDKDKYEKYDERFGHLFYKTPFSSYRLRIEYRFVGDQCPGGPNWAFRNSGVMLHCEDPKTMGKDQDFPASIEVQFLGGNGRDPRTTANLCTRARTSSKTACFSFPIAPHLVRKLTMAING